MNSGLREQQNQRVCLYGQQGFDGTEAMEPAIRGRRSLFVLSFQMPDVCESILHSSSFLRGVKKEGSYFESVGFFQVFRIFCFFVWAFTGLSFAFQVLAYELQFYAL